MALSNNILAVSEVSTRPNQKDEDFSSSPRVFIFARTPEGWKAQGAIQRDAKNTPWWFGISIALDGDTLAVGNPNALLPFTTDKLRPSLEPAMVCIYTKSATGWKLQQEIASTGLSPWQGFGVNIAMKGDLLAVRSVNPSNREDEIDVNVLRRVDGRWISEGALNPGQGVIKEEFVWATRLPLKEKTQMAACLYFKRAQMVGKKNGGLRQRHWCHPIHLEPLLRLSGRGLRWGACAVSDLELSLEARCYFNWTHSLRHPPRPSRMKLNKVYFHQRTLKARNNAPAANSNGRPQPSGHFVGAKGFSKIMIATSMPHQIAL